MKNILSITFSAILLLSSVAHIIYPSFYSPLIPEFFPETAVNILIAILEGLIGIALLLPKYRNLGGLGFTLLMLLFLPIHIWDLLKESPAVGPTPAPQIRLFVQFLLIYAGWWLYKKYSKESAIQESI